MFALWESFCSGRSGGCRRAARHCRPCGRRGLGTVVLNRRTIGNTREPTVIRLEKNRARFQLKWSRIDGGSTALARGGNRFGELSGAAR